MNYKNAVTAIAFVLTVLIPIAAFAAGPDEITLDSKIVSMKKAGVGPVIFTHLKHQQRAKCGICHTAIFIDKRGANDISMKKNMEGQFCGSANCHNSENAFTLDNCTACHTNIKKSSGK